MAKLRGSQSELRRANCNAILDDIHRFGAMTQIELAESTGLSTATVSTLVRQLVGDGELTTKGTVRNGRRATLVALAHKDGLGVGLAIHRRELELAILDYSYKVIAQQTLPLPDGHQIDTTLERAMLLVEETVNNAGAEVGEIKGVGVAVAAPVDKRSHTVAMPGILPGWEGADIISPVQAMVHAPVSVDNDSNMSATCEARIGAAKGHNDFVYISAGDGVGSTTVIGGRIMRGVTGLAGEIGHIQVDPLGSICACGNLGCLNTVVDERRLVSLLKVTHGSMTMDDLVRQANAGDPGCRRVIADAAVRIGTVSADLCTCVDPEIVIIGGKLATSGDIFLDPFKQSLERLLFPNALSPIQVLMAAHPSDCASIGAAIRALEHTEDSRIRNPAK